MSDPKNTPPVDTKVTPEVNLDTPEPNTHLQEWLKENNYTLAVEALTENTPFLAGKGFVMTDRPLLIVTVKKKVDQ